MLRGSAVSPAGTAHACMNVGNQQVQTRDVICTSELPTAESCIGRLRCSISCLSVKTAAFWRGPSGPRARGPMRPGVSQIEVAARATTSLGRLARVLRLSPTVSKRSVGLDLVEAGVVGFELVADPFDRGTHIGSVTVRAAS